MDNLVNEKFQADTLTHWVANGEDDAYENIFMKYIETCLHTNTATFILYSGKNGGCFVWFLASQNLQIPKKQTGHDKQ